MESNDSILKMVSSIKKIKGYVEPEKADMS